MRLSSLISGSTFGKSTRYLFDSNGAKIVIEILFRERILVSNITVITVPEKDWTVFASSCFKPCPELGRINSLCCNFFSTVVNSIPLFSWIILSEIAVQLFFSISEELSGNWIENNSPLVFGNFEKNRLNAKSEVRGNMNTFDLVPGYGECQECTAPKEVQYDASLHSWNLNIGKG